MRAIMKCVVIHWEWLLSMSKMSVIWSFSSVFLVWRILGFLCEEGAVCPTHYIQMKLSAIIAFAKNQNKQTKSPWTDSNTKPHLPLLSVNPSGAMTHDLVWFPSYISSLQRLQLPLLECSPHLPFWGWHDIPDLCSWVATANFMWRSFDNTFASLALGMSALKSEFWHWAEQDLLDHLL